MKHKLLLASIFLTAILTLTACQQNNSDLENTETMTSDTQASIPEQGSKEWFETVFFNNDDNPITNMFLTCEYDSPEEISFYDVFYHGSFISESSITEDELALLQERYDAWIELDTSKVTTGEMNDILKKYLNLTVEETKKNRLDMLQYLEEYDAYYHCAGDTNWMKCEITSFAKKEDGTVVIRCKDALSSMETEYEVTLREESGNYYFVSNKKIE